MRAAFHPGAMRRVPVALCALMLIVPSLSGAGPRLRPGLEVGASWGGMTGADRFATGDRDAQGHTGSFAAALVEVAWSDRWGILTGIRYREVEETAPTGFLTINGGIESADRLHTTLDQVSMPALVRVRPLPSPVLSLDLGPQLTWVTRAESAITWDPVFSALGAARARNAGARPEGMIFEDLSSGITAEYENLVLEGVAGVTLETPGPAHPAFLTLRYTGGLTGMAPSSTGGERRTNLFDLALGWHW